MQATCDKLAELKQRYKRVQLDDHSKGWNTDWLLAIELGYLLDVAQAMAHSALNRKESRGSHQRLDGFEQRDDVNFLKHSLAHYAGDDAPRIDYGAGEDHQLASPARAPTARPARRPMREAQGRRRPCLSAARRIEIEVLRYRPEQESEPVWQSYNVPFTDDMSVLQGLQYIKDDLDGTLSFRWSCRMAICGSCGMMINGKPKLSCQTFLRDLLPGPVRVEALAHFPIERDLVVERRRLRQEAREHQALHHPQGAAHAGAGRVPADARAARAVRAVQLVHQLHAVLRGLPAVRAEPRLHRPGRAGAAAPLQRRFARRRPRRAHGGAQRRGRRVELHRGGLLLRGLPQGRGSGQRGQPEQGQQRQGLLPALPLAAREQRK